MGQMLFVPFSEELLDQVGTPPGKLVPFHIEYKCVRLRENGEDILVLQSDHDEPPCIAAEV